MKLRIRDLAAKAKSELFDIENIILEPQSGGCIHVTLKGDGDTQATTTTKIIELVRSTKRGKLSRQITIQVFGGPEEHYRWEKVNIR